jgi:hypothetical protein
VLQVIALVGLGGLPQDLGDLGLDLVQGVAGGVGGHLGGFQCDHAKADHAGGFAQLERSDQEVGQGLLVADAEAGDGYVVGCGWRPGPERRCPRSSVV